MGKYSITYNEKKNCIFITLEGVLKVKEIAKSMDEVLEIKGLNKNIKILSNAINGEMSFDIKGVYQLLRKIKQLSSDYDQVLNAFVINKSKETAYSLLFKSLITFPNLRFEVFTSIDAAEEWLNKFQFHSE